MITANFKKVIAGILEADGSVFCYFPVVNTSGVTKYMSRYYNSFPKSQSDAYITAETSAGIALGSGTAAASENDYALGNMITTGLSVNVNKTNSLDASGNPQKVFSLEVTNVRSSDVTIAEIGYIQCVPAGNSDQSTNASNTYLLLDRTLLSSPVTIAAGGTKVITYTLKTTIS